MWELLITSTILPKAHLFSQQTTPLLESALTTSWHRQFFPRTVRLEAFDFETKGRARAKGRHWVQFCTFARSHSTCWGDFAFAICIYEQRKTRMGSLNLQDMLRESRVEYYSEAATASPWLADRPKRRKKTHGLMLVGQRTRVNAWNWNNKAPRSEHVAKPIISWFFSKTSHLLRPDLPLPVEQNLRDVPKNEAISIQDNAVIASWRLKWRHLQSIFLPLIQQHPYYRFLVDNLFINLGC